MQHMMSSLKGGVRGGVKGGVTNWQLRNESAWTDDDIDWGKSQTMSGWVESWGSGKGLPLR